MSLATSNSYVLDNEGNKHGLEKGLFDTDYSLLFLAMKGIIDAYGERGIDILAEFFDFLSPSTMTMVRFDESLGFYDHIFTRAYISLRRGKSSKSFGIFSGNAPKDVVAHVALEASKQEDVDRVKISDKEAHFLMKFVGLTGFQTAILSFQRTSRDVSDSHEEEGFSSPQFAFKRKDGSIITHEKLSYGQKRLLALLFYFDINKDIIIADELVNGLHYRWIEDCIVEMEGRQKFLTSQNPLLLDHLVFDSVEDVRKSLFCCSCEDDGNKEHMIWQNMSIDHSRSFFNAYKAGIQHVGEILQTRGFW